MRTFAREQRAGSTLPRSCTSYGTGLVGLLGFAAGMWMATSYQLPTAVRVLVVITVTSLPMVLWGLLFDRVMERPTAALMRPSDTGNLQRLYIKLLGFAATLGLVAFGYWLFPIYRQPFYGTFFDLAALTLPWLGAAGVFYIYWLDGRMAEPKDGAWHLGALITGQYASVDWDKLRSHLLGWTIKAYFLPIMLGWLGGNLDWLAKLHETMHWGGANAVLYSAVSGLATLQPLQWLSEGLSQLSEIIATSNTRDFLTAFDAGLTLIFSLDLCFAALGYVLTLRAIDGQIRSPEPTLLGWMVALICYPPYGDTTINLYVNWSDNFEWRNWLAGEPGVLFLWGAAILTLETLFALATVSFGYRFSNLTHRGILTHGLYRLTKHPAYITKCVSFWLIAVPFVPDQGWNGAARQVLMMLGINFVYWMRARTEERHLSRDPVYVAYALWIEKHGIFRWVGKIIPAMRYRPPSSHVSLQELAA